MDGKLRLSPVLPVEWQAWTCLPVFVDCVEFEASTSFLAASDPAPDDSRRGDDSLDDKPPFVTEREPKPLSMIGLAEAATWAAFCIALDGYELGLFEDAGEVSAIANPRYSSAARALLP